MNWKVVFSVLLFQLNIGLYVCEEEYNGHTYKVINESKTWGDARDHCQSMGMDLLVINDEAELNFSTEAIKRAYKYSYAWIGLYKTADDDSTLRWVDDTPFVYNDPAYLQPWQPGEPNNLKHRCIRLTYNAGYTDRHCENYKYYSVCEKGPPSTPETPVTIAQSRFKPNAKVGKQLFCPKAVGTSLLGDVNGDGVSDQLCSRNGEMNITVGNKYTETTSVTLKGCSEATDVVKMGDINGDGRSDIVCVTENGGVMVWISKDENPNFYDSEPWTDEQFGFCVGFTKWIKVSDFNGDGLVDLLCAPVVAGKRSLALGEKAGSFRAPLFDPNFKDFCTADNKEPFIGDFDADGRTDLVCRVDKGKQYEIALTDGDGLLVNEDFKTVDSWCNGTGDTFLVGDMNGDEHDDWVCHHQDGTVCVKYNSLIFADSDMFKLESCNAFGSGTGGGENGSGKAGVLKIADYTGDGLPDMYWVGDDGSTSIAIATVQAPLVDFVQVDWDSDVAWSGIRFCKDKELYVGDVNGDRRQDVVCHENKGGRMQRILGNNDGQLIIQNKWTSFEDPNSVGRFCHRTHQNPEYPKRYNGDTNGDDRMDVLCHSQLTGNVDVSFADPNGAFAGSTSLKANFCQGDAAKLSVADLDADGKVDLMCKTLTETNIWLQDGQDLLTVESDWCADLFDEILVGHLFDKNSQDLLCHNRKTGAKSILNVTSAREVQTVEVNENKEWCLSKDKKQLKTGDFNGDKLTDLLCHKDDGEMVILLHQDDQRANSTWFGEEFTAAVNFCSEPGSTLSVFDANGDGYDDLTCHTSTGRITISESHLVKARARKKN